jgi:hypothetical protein
MDRTRRLVAALQAGVLVATLGTRAHAQDSPSPLPSSSMFGFQSLIDGPPSRSGMPPADCPSLGKHVPGRPRNEWTPDTLPDGCRPVQASQDDRPPHSRFAIRTYIDIATVGWDDTYGTVIPSIAGFHVSFANIGTWTLGAGGLLASLSPIFDLRSNTRQYQISPRLNMLNVNKTLKPLTPHYDLCFSLEATRELFMPLAATLDGSHQFNNVFAGVSISSRPR